MVTPHGLAVSEHGPTRASGLPLVVLVHGSLDRSTSFARVLRRLADLPTLVYDRRGYHKSRTAHPLHDTFDGHVDDLLEVIDGRRAVVVGHSYGGDVAIAGSLRPEARDSILAVAAYEPPMPWLAGYRSESGGGSSSPIGGDPDHRDGSDEAERFFRRMVGDASWERLSTSAKAALRAEGPALAAELAAIRTGEAPFDVSSIKVPTVFGVGGNSADRHRLAVAWLVEHTPGAQRFEIAGAAHGAHLTHPDGFAAMVRTAVDRAGWQHDDDPGGAR